MAGLQLTYMLLPNFSFTPAEVPLGTLLTLSDETKLPDPSLPLVDGDKRVPIDPKLIKFDPEEPKVKPWRYAGIIKRGKSSGFDFDIPFISALSLGFDFKNSKGYDIVIECRRVETSSFVPTKRYISLALQDDFVKEFTASQWRPSVFMVTGVKVAYDVKIDHGTNRDRDLSGKAAVDLTSVGAPLKLGPKAGDSKSRDEKFQTEKPGPLVLAYQLKRIRPKKDGTFTAAGFYKKAFLYDDNLPEAAGTTAEENLDEFWDIEDVVEVVEAAGEGMTLTSEDMTLTDGDDV